jgi:hypothetical protein
VGPAFQPVFWRWRKKFDRLESLSQILLRQAASGQVEKGDRQKWHCRRSWLLREGIGGLSGGGRDQEGIPVRRRARRDYRTSGNIERWSLMNPDPLILSEFSPWVIAYVIVGIVLLVFIFIILQFLNLWIRAFMAQAGISLLDLIAMRLRKVDDKKVVNAAIALVQGGISNVDVRGLEAHYLAGGNVEAVAKAMIAARQAGVQLDFSKACAVDLAGGDLMEVARQGLGLA